MEGEVRKGTCWCHRLICLPLYYGNHSFCVQAVEAFYEDASQYNDQLTFDDMNLSRPILKVNCHNDQSCQSSRPCLSQTLCLVVFY